MSIPLINRTAVRKRALEIAAQNWAQGFSRVGASFLERVETKVRNLIYTEVMQHPSKGKTLL